MKVANHPLSKKLAEHFRSKGAERLWCGEMQVVQNEEFRREVLRIRGEISKRHPLKEMDRNTFSTGFFTHLILPNPENPNMPWRRPLIVNIERLCEALGWDFADVWVDRDSNIKIDELPAAKQKIIRAVEAGGPRMITALLALVDALSGEETENKDKPARKEHPEARSF